jgi:signal recognition particle subunit SRP54
LDPGESAGTLPAVFDTLSDKLQHALGDLRGRGRLDEESVSKAMREIRLALLEADVNLQVVKDFVARVKERAVGEEVTKSLTPGQQVVKIVHEELTEIMGGGDSRLAYAQRGPTTILLAGLQGSGKTTAAAKLALMLRKEGKTPALVAADLQRPAAIDQLEQLGRQIQVSVYGEERKDPVAAAERGLAWATEQGAADVVIVDSAGRHQVDEALMEELGRIAAAIRPTNVLLVLDAMTGQEAVNVAEAFQEQVAFDGIVLTKLDGDARGGAALSVRAVTGRPIKLASTGEKLDQLDWFHPDRMASRILGMGDVLTLVEKAEAAVEADEQAEMEARLRAGEFTFDDFLASYKMLRKMGPLKGVLSMIPGVGSQLKGLEIDERELARVEAIILSMTPRERGFPHTIDGSRRQRIARGSGTTVQEVSRLLNARKEMQKLMKQMGKGKMPALPGLAGRR